MKVYAVLGYIEENKANGPDCNELLEIFYDRESAASYITNRDLSKDDYLYESYSIEEKTIYGIKPIPHKD